MIVVQEYDPIWKTHFETLSNMLREATWNDIVIEHVGSTSVPGLASKPIIDMDIIVCREEIDAVIEHLSVIGYEHRGNLGIEDREAFYPPKEIGINHHLYVCVEGAEAVRNHIILRNHLRSHPESLKRYGSLKMKLAQEFPNDIDSYISGKTSYITELLSIGGMTIAEISSIEDANLIQKA